MELKFTKEKLPGGFDYEWAIRNTSGRIDIIFHFFLGDKKPNQEFFFILEKVIRSCVPKTCGVETLYTEDFDGHDAIIYNVESWKAEALKNSLIKKISNEIPGEE